MKNFLTILLVLITTAAGARDFKVHGPQGGADRRRWREPYDHAQEEENRGPVR